MFKTRLIIQLSFWGLVMGLATIWFIPFEYEQYFWLVIFIYSAYRIGKIHRGNYFLHGVFTSILNGVWYSIVHVFFYHQYIGLHQEELMMFHQLSLENSPKFAMLISGPIFGAIFGILLGGMAVGAHLIIKKTKKR